MSHSIITRMSCNSYSVMDMLYVALVLLVVIVGAYHTMLDPGQLPSCHVT